MSVTWYLLDFCLCYIWSYQMNRPYHYPLISVGVLFHFGFLLLPQRDGRWTFSLLKNFAADCTLLKTLAPYANNLIFVTIYAGFYLSLVHLSTYFYISAPFRQESFSTSQQFKRVFHNTFLHYATSLLIDV